jgi:DNA processing protein
MNTIITVKQSHPYYPRRLLDLPDAPQEIYCLGNLEALKIPGLGIVGSRQASKEGMATASYFAKAVVHQGLLVISGLADGIDSAAHTGALQAQARLSTIAVCGTGLDRCYPSKNEHLFQIIARQGLLISEYPPGTIIKPHFFRQRNRLIAALSLGILVVEAAIRSGSLTTAKYANDLGREVFAIPHSIHQAQAMGCHQLIKEGAKLVGGPEDIFEELRFFQK